MPAHHNFSQRNAHALLEESSDADAEQNPEAQPSDDNTSESVNPTDSTSSTTSSATSSRNRAGSEANTATSPSSSTRVQTSSTRSVRPTTSTRTSTRPTATARPSPAPTTQVPTSTSTPPAIVIPDEPANLPATARTAEVGTVEVDGEELDVVARGDTAPTGARAATRALDAWINDGTRPIGDWRTFTADDPDAVGWRWAAINQETGDVVYVI